MATDTSRFGVVVPAPKGYVSEKRRSQPRVKSAGMSLGRILAKSGVRASMFRAA